MLRRIGRFVYLSQLWMALSAGAFVFSQAVLLGRQLPLAAYWLAVWGTWTVYVLDARRGTRREDATNQPLRARFFRRHDATVVAALVLGALPAPWLVGDLHPNLSADALLLVLGLIGVAYVMRLVPGGGRRRTLKQIGIGKSFVITAAWLLGGLGVPLAFGRPTGAGPAAPLEAVAVVSGLLLFLDTVALDWRDRAGDLREGIQTAATALGRLCEPFLVRMTIITGFVWFVFLPFGGMRWFLYGAALAAWLVVVLRINQLERQEIPFGVAISAWRFVAAIVLVGFAGW